MNYLNIEKIDVKKTKVNLTVSLDLNENLNSDTAFITLLSMGVLAGGSSNCIRQISEIPFTKTAIDFDEANKLKIEYLELLRRFKDLLNQDELTKAKESHVFK